jgi:hypothetical protein
MVASGMSRAPGKRPDTPPSSPACLAHEFGAGGADDTYMGFATAEEISAFRKALADAEQQDGAPESVIASLKKMMPRVRDDAIFAELKIVLDRQEARQLIEK